MPLVFKKNFLSFFHLIFSCIYDCINVYYILYGQNINYLMIFFYIYFVFIIIHLFIK